MKIAFVCNEYPPQPHGGIGTFVGMLAPALAERGHRVTVVGMGGEPGERTSRGVRVVTLKWDRRPVVGNVISRLRLWNFLRREVRARRVDLIEVPDHMGWLPVPVPGCPSVVRLHLSDSIIKARCGGERGRGGIARYERATLRRNSRWIAVSQCVLDLTRQQFDFVPRASRVIFNPVAVSTGATATAPELPAEFVLYASAVSTRKGALVAAAAMRPVLEERPNLHLVYAGWVTAEAGVLVSASIAEILGPDLLPRVHFLGRIERDAVLACLARARAFVFPSRLEALPIALLEAMGQGTPVVCSNHPPGPEVVEDEVTGLLADPDRPADFTRAIRRLLDDVGLATRLAKAAQAVAADRHSLARCLAESVEFYREARGEPRRSVSDCVPVASVPPATAAAAE